MSTQSHLLTEEGFDRVCAALLGELRAGPGGPGLGTAGDEHLTLGLIAESSHFVRFNGARVRQTGTVLDAKLSLTYVLGRAGSELRSGRSTITLTGSRDEDLRRARAALAHLREEVASLPVDPYAVLPQAGESSRQITEGALLAPEEAVPTIAPLMTGLDLAGIYASGSMIRASANSAGQKHWFFTETFSLDYSLYTQSERAVKGVFSGSQWRADEFKRTLADSASKLSALERPARKIAPGEYRTFLAPEAVHDLAGMMGWGFFSEQAIRQGESAARFLRSGERTLSPLFSYAEDFTPGAVPRFNADGEVSPERVALVDHGKLAGTLVSSRSAREFGIQGNGASAYEAARSPVMAAGDLASGDVLRRLGTGLYLSNLHYLNWSDQPEGRITGMTRYACFWVENGELVAPIENLRWDDTLFRIFGSELEAVTAARAQIPEVSTYESRQLGNAVLPGVLLRSFRYTL